MDTESNGSGEAGSTSAMTLSEYLVRIYSDQILTPSEYQGLRDEADRVIEKLIKQFPDNVHLTDFQKFADDTAQAMQLGIMDIRKTKPSSAVKADIKESFGFQVAYIKACLDIFTQRL